MVAAGAIVLAVFWMGIYPESFLRMTATTWAACSSEWSGWCRPGDSHLTLGKSAAHINHGAH